MKKQPRHLIFLLKSNRLGLCMEGGSDPVCQADSPQRSLATKDGEAPVKDLGCLLIFSLSSFPLLIHSFVHSLVTFSPSVIIADMHGALTQSQRLCLYPLILSLQ